MTGAANAHSQNRTAVFAGGCFWCMEQPFTRTNGVVDVVVGYCGGDEPNPRYEQVARGLTGHLEAVQVTYDPQQVSYRELIEVFWRAIDPTDPGGQFADRGRHYTTAIFYADEEERHEAEAAKKQLDASGKFSEPVATAIRPLSTFYPAEEYHQGYYRKNSVHYQAYKIGSGRAGFLARTWPIPPPAETVAGKKK
jgi:peptide methionine sulfoxide reductase msrA/msrB